MSEMGVTSGHMVTLAFDALKVSCASCIYHQAKVSGCLFILAFFFLDASGYDTTQWWIYGFFRQHQEFYIGPLVVKQSKRYHQRKT